MLFSAALPQRGIRGSGAKRRLCNALRIEPFRSNLPQWRLFSNTDPVKANRVEANRVVGQFEFSALVILGDIPLLAEGINILDASTRSAD